ncbi:sulfatase-like hydrolase/transferase [Pedobacter sp. MC2016-05]|uniref:sulfatase-like hydrolase/transferase n=1 Tax=Pedobacter sp. MC2016-05 TaxID=2994474 RepID=UPI002247B796|nr:sulfatase-like hydrolase/transferase [Pedobacter sp. MC2016-05]MCX2473784.1 sulfatase-like hydrolase/transferase [Pedobacter sp. MC2016-05]
MYLIKPVIYVLTFVLPFTAGNVLAQQKDKRGPNILFILTDDLGYGDVGVFFQNKRAAAQDRSSPFTLTPNLDEMAASGATLSQHYCAAPVCAPSRASILLGQSQGHANVRDNQFDKALGDNYTLGNVMQKVGYATVAIGKWGLQGEKEWPAHPLNRGFDYFYGYMRHADGHEHYPKEGLYRGKKEVWENRTEVSQDLDKCYAGDLWTARAKKWIIDHQQGNGKDQPFFMFLAYDTPHAVLELPASAYPEGGGLNGGLQWLGMPGKMINTANGIPDSYTHPDYIKATYDDDHNSATPEKPWPETYKRFATSTRRIDDEVGDILQLLKDLRIDSNTMVIFSSDNGPSIESYLPLPQVRYDANFFSSFGPFDGIKRDVLDGGMRIPLIAKWTGHIPAHTEVHSPSISYDWMPTFLDAAGVAAPVVADGVSLLPSLTGKGKQPASMIYSEYFEGGKTPAYPEFEIVNQGRIRKQMQMIRMDNMVGIRYAIKSQDDNFQIFDVSKDFHQQLDLGQNKGLAILQTKMKDMVLHVRRQDTEAPRPYDTVAVPAIANRKLVKGLFWKTYQSATPWIPNPNGLRLIASGIDSGMGLGAMGRGAGNMVTFEGFIKIPADGEYVFHLSVVGKAFVRMHDAVLIDEDYGYTSKSKKVTKIKLRAGLHPIRIYYQRAASENGKINLEWSGTSFAKHQVPQSVFFH